MKRSRHILKFFILVLTLIISISLISCEKESNEEVKIPSADEGAGYNADNGNEDNKAPENESCLSHIDLDKDKKCDKCGADFIAECIEHSDENADHKCDYCSLEYTECIDGNEDGECDICEKVLEAEPEKQTCEQCISSDYDKRCDVCGELIECDVCMDSDKNAKCDICGRKVDCVECIDENYNGVCDVCVGRVELKPHDCIDADGDLICDLCEQRYVCKLCTDKDVDGICDICQFDHHALHCIDLNYNGICEICFADVEIADKKDCTECIDFNGDDWCDNCGLLVIDDNRSFLNIVPKVYTDEFLLGLNDYSYFEYKENPLKAECISDPKKTKFVIYEWDEDTKVFDMSIARNIEEYQAREEYIGGDTRQIAVLASENYFKSYSGLSGFLDRNGCFTYETLQSGVGPSSNIKSIDYFLESLSFGEITAEEIKETYPGGLHRWYNTGFFVGGNWSSYMVSEGCKIVLYYDFETHVLNGYGIVLYNF